MRRKQMISFASDYTTGAHPDILKRLIDTNLEPVTGYGTDIYTKNAEEKIKKACKCADAQVYIATGGTQTNRLVISTMLDDYEGVVAADTGHISAHEAGAIEYSGHKVLTIQNHMGKIDAGELKTFIDTFYADENHEHMVFPGMVYISQPTEYGSLYSKAELKDIHDVCQKAGIPLFIDGARLAYALTSDENDVSLDELCNLCDVFYIGGTKAGALCGEAIVFTKNNMPKHFITLVKQRGDLIAKGRLLGIQFETLFTDDLYFKIGRHVNECKDELVKILKDAGFEFFYESPTNQQFVIIDNDKLKELEKEVTVSFWEKYDDNRTVIRFATGWSTTDDDLGKLKDILDKFF